MSNKVRKQIDVSYKISTSFIFKENCVFIKEEVTP